MALSQRPPSGRYTYGLKGSSILAALLNAIILMLAVGVIAWESIGRLYNPQPVASATIMAVAAAGIVVNGITAWLFTAGRKHDLNIRGAYLHMVADAAVSLGVVAAGLAIGLTGALWIDPVSSLVIVVVIAWTTWDLLRESLTLSLAGVPANINAVAVSRYLEAPDGVRSVHDLHIWSISMTDVAMTAHLVMPGGHPGDAFLQETARGLEDLFKIGHVALQIETGETDCPLAPPDVV